MRIIMDEIKAPEIATATAEEPSCVERVGGKRVWVVWEES